MAKYSVVQTLQSANNPANNPPVGINYYRGDDRAQAIVAMGVAAMLDDPEWTTLISVELLVSDE